MMELIQQDQDEILKAIVDTLSAEAKRSIEQYKGKGTFSCLNILPIQAHGFTLNK